MKSIVAGVGLEGLAEGKYFELLTDEQKAVFGDSLMLNKGGQLDTTQILKVLKNFQNSVNKIVRLELIGIAAKLDSEKVATIDAFFDLKIYESKTYERPQIIRALMDGFKTSEHNSILLFSILSTSETNQIQSNDLFTSIDNFRTVYLEPKNIPAWKTAPNTAENKKYLEELTQNDLTIEKIK
jgi:hypothetical protein